ncbi:MAG: hypothetical protein M5R41_13925 [Bacteroidia bacterium]|nr:hypothetical protein [Bacteroidia bacterium]
MSDYTPKFFDREDFAGLVAIIETMIDTGGEAAVHPVNAAKQVDTYLSRVESPALEQIRLAIDAIDSWYMPLFLAFRFGRFSKLPLHERRKVVERIITPKGLFKVIAIVRAGARDAARTLKLLASIGYYNGEEGTRMAGYVPAEERPRFIRLDQAPLAHADPFPKGGV